MPESPAPRSDKSTLWFAIGLILGMAIGYFFGTRANRIRTEAAEQGAIALPTAVVDVSVDGRPFKGPSDAAVTILEFTDYECAFCARFYAETYKPLVEEYGDRVKFVTRNFPISQIHPNAQKAAEAAECAGDQGQFWPYHDMLFEHQDALDVESLMRYAEDLGMDKEEFGLCLSSGKKAAIIQADMDAGLSYGVDGAPIFFINGRKLEGFVPFEFMKQLIEQAEGEAGQGR